MKEMLTVSMSTRSPVTTTVSELGTTFRLYVITEILQDAHGAHDTTAIVKWQSTVVVLTCSPIQQHAVSALSFELFRLLPTAIEIIAGSYLFR